MTEAIGLGPSPLPLDDYKVARVKWYMFMFRPDGDQCLFLRAERTDSDVPYLPAIRLAVVGLVLNEARDHGVLSVRDVQVLTSFRS